MKYLQRKIIYLTPQVGWWLVENQRWGHLRIQSLERSKRHFEFRRLVHGERRLQPRLRHFSGQGNKIGIWVHFQLSIKSPSLLSGWPEDDTLNLGSVKISQTSKATLLGWKIELKARNLLDVISFWFDKGLSTQDLSLDTSEKGETLVGFPSMSKVVSECGAGCQWGYVVKFTGVSMSEAIHNNVIVIQNV